MTFDRTYEGLKPSGPTKSSFKAVTAFDRTYEGLKRGLGQGPLHGLRAPFDRTYEGLKQVPHLHHQEPGLGLLTVPMRV